MVLNRFQWLVCSEYSPLVETQRGGNAGGGTTLTPMGKSVLKIYRGIESDAQKAVAKRLSELLAMIRADMD